MARHAVASDATLNKLEFHKIIRLLTEACSAEVGKTFAQKIKPSNDRDTVLRWQAETAEAVHLQLRDLEIPLGGLVDVRAQLQKLKIEDVLHPEDFLRIRSLLYVTRKMQRYLLDPQRLPHIPQLAVYGERLTECPAVMDEIDRIVLEDATIADRASGQLHNIRQKLKTQKQQIRRRMEQYLSDGASQAYFQDLLITMRANRFVLPVKAEYRQRFPGIVHDQSASGATLYIEPAALVERNNDVQQLEISEQQEIQKILAELSAFCVPYREALSQNLKTMTYLDVVFAKARLSNKMQGVRPQPLMNAAFRFRHMRHPLIDPGAVVPIDVSLGEQARCMIITGPNTGGKTVSLKSAGLMILMYQSGLQLPVHDDSYIGIFDHVMADIGDEQSIEQSLSTFSSHLTNIVGILNQLTTDSFVIFDELGAGTDPIEGASLAMAILEAAMARGSVIMATTHYSELKTFAYETPGVINASVEFDVQSLRPTYRLLIGVPGNSNALAIAQRIGLPKNIIDRAQAISDASKSEVGMLVERLENTQQEVLLQQHHLQTIQQDLTTREARLVEQEGTVQEKTDQILNKAREKAAEILLDAKREAEQVQRELKELSKSGRLEASQRASEMSRQLSDAAYKTRNKKKPSASTANDALSEQDIRIGQEVFLTSFGQPATVLTLPDKNGELQVQAGIIKMSVRLKDLRLQKKSADKPLLRTPKKSGGSSVKAVRTKLDLRGQTAEEALALLDKFLDDCYLANAPQVEIIHGKGTGVLRKVVTDALKHHPHVSSHRLGAFNEGGDGVTIADLR